ncbi:MAG: hypothetical protein KKD73_04290 [Proteobacteria bacterium]|nr:hypothetical protein [Pseudomonadota bacterium]MBU1639660.1 hypothetical protein [Pseudomonadota bacterium]
MDDRLQELLAKINKLEREIMAELQKKQQEYRYEIKNKKVYFEQEIKRQNRRLAKRVRYYLKDAPLLNIITTPFIWACLPPALVLDLFVTVFQFICFPVYAIPKVKREDYIVIDRHYLSYLNWIEKINCYYCSYFNGLIAYIQEIAARTEQYWCPIKHAKPSKSMHSRYKNFFDYGDGSGFRKKNRKVRRDFRDLT